MKNKLIYVITILIFVLLIITPDISSASAKNGLVLWANVVIPSLLPSMILTSFMVKIHATSLITKITYPVLSPIYKLSREGTFCIISGILCGYPMGVKCVNDLLNEKRISEKEAKQLLAICSFPSPMFMMSYVVNSRLSHPSILPLYLASTYLSTIPLNLIAKFIYKSKKCKSSPTDNFPITIRFQMFEDCVISGCSTMIKIGVYMMFFSIIAGWVNNLQKIPRIIKMLICIILEMTTGVNAAASSDLTLNARTAACIFATSFGGLCTMAQTFSIINNKSIKRTHYLLFKILHGLLSVLILKLLFCIRLIL